MRLKYGGASFVCQRPAESHLQEGADHRGLQPAHRSLITRSSRSLDTELIRLHKVNDDPITRVSLIASSMLID